MLLVCELRGVEPMLAISCVYVIYAILNLIGIRLGVDCNEI